MFFRQSYNAKDRSELYQEMISGKSSFAGHLLHKKG